MKLVKLFIYWSSNWFFPADKGVLHSGADEQQVIERCYPQNLMLSELPEPPIPLSEIGPIPPPPMFSSPSPTLISRQRQQQMPLLDCEDDGIYLVFHSTLIIQNCNCSNNEIRDVACRRRGHRRGRRGHVRHRHDASRGDPGERAQVPRDAAEERTEEEGRRKRARYAPEYANPGSQAAHASPGTPRVIQVRRSVVRMIKPTNTFFSLLFLLSISHLIESSIVYFLKNFYNRALDSMIPRISSNIAPRLFPYNSLYECYEWKLEDVIRLGHYFLCVCVSVVYSWFNFYHSGVSSSTSSNYNMLIEVLICRRLSLYYIVYKK